MADFKQVINRKYCKPSTLDSSLNTSSGSKGIHVLTSAYQFPTKVTPVRLKTWRRPMGSPATRVQTFRANPILESGVQPQIRSLVVSSELENRRPLVRILGSLGVDVVVCNRLAEAAEILSRTLFNAVFCDEYLPDGAYSDLIQVCNSGGGIPRLIVTSRNGDWDLYFQTLAKGAFDMIRCPCHSTDVEMVLIRLSRGGEASLGASV
jgi:CheY-like chemotaxis protein